MGKDGALMEEYANALAAAVEEALPRWVTRSVERILIASSGTADPAVMAEAAEAGLRATADVMPRLRALLATDVDQQRTNPLSILRSAVRYPTEVLRAAGVPPVRRDDFDVRAFPDDDYGLAPASFADVDPALHEPGLAWGAA
ncbi:MAG: hypothetical protein ACRDJP_12355, partial [Actinomycetota bacterium]